MRKSIRFYDDINFPKGFNRKGFTIKEAIILDNYGLTMKGLIDNSLIPDSKEEELFLLGVKNEDKSVSLFVHCWLKYLDLITTKPKFHTLCGSKSR
ncbi:DUF413 domain-containing protein [Aliivibrio wodanis]|uniref:DUF413 domain-containing protein n=1 Tax=Aliivibrio wodanis TaxID=80852 RepID=UPI00406CA9BC